MHYENYLYFPKYFTEYMIILAKNDNSVITVMTVKYLISFDKWEIATKIRYTAPGKSQTMGYI